MGYGMITKIKYYVLRLTLKYRPKVVAGLRLAPKRPPRMQRVASTSQQGRVKQ